MRYAGSCWQSCIWVYHWNVWACGGTITLSSYTILQFPKTQENRQSAWLKLGALERSVESFKDIYFSDNWPFFWISLSPYKMLPRHGTSTASLNRAVLRVNREWGGGKQAPWFLHLSLLRDRVAIGFCLLEGHKDIMLFIHWLREQCWQSRRGNSSCALYIP